MGKTYRKDENAKVRKTNKSNQTKIRREHLAKFKGRIDRGTLIDIESEVDEIDDIATASLPFDDSDDGDDAGDRYFYNNIEKYVKC